MTKVPEHAEESGSGGAEVSAFGAELGSGSGGAGETRGGGEARRGPCGRTCFPSLVATVASSGAARAAFHPCSPLPPGSLTSAAIRFNT